MNIVMKKTLKEILNDGFNSNTHRIRSIRHHFYNSIKMTKTGNIKLTSHHLFRNGVRVKHRYVSPDTEMYLEAK